MSIRLDQELREQMLSQARRCYPSEACGLLIGRWEDGDARGLIYHACENQRENNRERRFLIDPMEYQEVEDRADEQGLSIVSIVHSHPDHPDEPSEFDRLHAWPGLSYVIIAVHQGKIAGYRSWRLRDDRSHFDAEPIIG